MANGAWDEQGKYNEWRGRGRLQGDNDLGVAIENDR
jgi:hypothetical protein